MVIQPKAALQTRLKSTAYWEFVTLPENADKHFELIDGEIVEKVGSFTPSEVAATILYRTFAHAFTPPLNPLPIAWRGDFKMRFSPPLQYLERGPGGEVSESPTLLS